MLKNKVISILLCLQIIFVFITNAVEISETEKSDVNIYVCLTGNDGGNGNIDNPFNSLEKARDYVRVHKSQSAIDHNINVVIREGVYYFDDSFELSYRDSGSEKYPITYTAYPEEEVVFSGAKHVDMSKAVEVTDRNILARLPEESRGKVLQVNLKEQGIIGLGNIAQLFYGSGREPDPDLLWDGEIQTIARWPNDDYARAGTILYSGYSLFTTATRFRPRDDDPGFIFKTDAPRAHLWPDAKDAWLYGLWMHNWAADTVRVKNVVNDLVFTKTSTSFGTTKGAWYYIFNLLEELDVPGEWYIDSDTDILYVYPPSPITADTEVMFTYLNKPMLNMQDANDIIIQNITLAAGKSNAIRITGGSRVKIAGCTIRNFNANAVIINNAHRTGVLSCDLYNLGATGISISSGDRNALEARGCYAVNNNIYNFARVERMYNPGVRISGGVGNYVAYNKIHGAPHSAIIFSGNDHIFEYNHIFDVLKEASDAGAIYCGRDFLGHGNIIRYNFIDDIIGAGMAGAAVGIYYDDMWSSTVSHGNIINNTEMPFMIGGGRHNTITNNIVMNKLPRSERSLSLDSRGTGWYAQHMNWMYEALERVNYKNKVWQERYPDAMQIVNDDPQLPKYNVVRNNIVYNHSPMSVADNFYRYSNVSDNLVLEKDTDIGFVDEKNGNFTLREDSVVFRRLPEFEAIDFDRIGLYIDEYRKSLEK